MKAAVYRKYGPPEVVHVEDVPKPEPKADEVLIRVRASTVASADWRVRTLKVPEGLGLLSRLALGVLGPRKKILGTELAGEIEAVGPKVTRFKPGDRVFAFPGIGMGGHGEYRAMRETAPIQLLPRGFSFEQGAAISFGGTTALHFLRDKAGLRQGEEVLVIGASGAVGSAAVQIAKAFGARVTGVTSAGNVETVKSLGADRVIDYTRADALDGQAAYDVIFDAVGNVTYSSAKKALKAGGRLILIVAGLPEILRAAFGRKENGHRVLVGGAPERAEDLLYLRELCESGRYKPLIDREFPLARIVEAHALVETGRKRGSVVVTMG